MTSVAPRERLTKDQAADQGLVPHGHTWDEEGQQAVPIGMALMVEAVRKGVDLGESLEALGKNRGIIIKYIANQMVESEYNAKGYPIPGKMGDFYKLPNYSKKALTKQGSEKLAQLARLRRARTASVERQCTKDFTMAVVQVELVDPFGQPAGSGEAACTTAESGFTSDEARKKYGNDMRAALNDVVSRAGKRAFVQAVVYATATDELFDTAGELDKVVEAHGGTEEEQPGFRMPESAKLGSVSGRLIKECSSEELTGLRDRMKARLKDPGAWQSTLDAIDVELDSRRAANDEDTPF